MRKLCLRLIIIAIVLQPLVEFVIGRRFELHLFGYYWQFFDLLAMLAIGLLVMTWLPEQKALRFTRRRRLPVGYKLAFALLLLFVLAGTVKGLLRGYYATLGDAETLVWALGSMALGWLVNVTSADLQAHLSLLRKGALAIAAVTIPHALSTVITGAPTFGYLHYDGYFLMVFGLFTYLGDNSAQSKVDKQLPVGLIVLIAALMLNLNKAILFSLLVALPGVWMVSRLGEARSALLEVRLTRIVTITLVFVMLLSCLSVLFPTSFGDYYQLFWEERVLHQAELSALDVDLIAGGRMDLWRVSFYWFRQAPWLGQGIGFRLIEGLSLTLQDVQAGLHTHNQYLYLLTALGMPASLLIITMIASFTSITATTIRRDQAFRPSVVRSFLAFWGFLWFMLGFGLVGLWNISPVGTVLMGLSFGISFQLVLRRHSESSSLC